MKTNLTLAITLALVAASNALAGSATWLRNPLDGDWNNPANWWGEGPPNGPEDVATFNFSLLGDVFLSAPTTLDTLVVSVHADSVNYTITAPTGTQLSFAGTGITSFSYL